VVSFSRIFFARKDKTEGRNMVKKKPKAVIQKKLQFAFHFKSQQSKRSQPMFAFVISIDHGRQ
jgi:hypothetical protein